MCDYRAPFRRCQLASLEGLSLVAADLPQHTHTLISPRVSQQEASDDEARFRHDSGFEIVRRSFGVERVGRLFFLQSRARLQAAQEVLRRQQRSGGPPKTTPPEATSTKR